MSNLLLDPYPPQAEIKKPYPGMVILVQDGLSYQFQEVVRIEDGKPIMAPYLRGIKGTNETYLKNNRFAFYLVLETITVAEFLTLPEDTEVSATTFGHHEPETFKVTKAELLEEYHLVSKDSIPR